MSIDRSLKISGALNRHRNVLSRDERIEKLQEEGVWAQGDSLMGLPKVAHRKATVGKKDAKEKTEEGAEGIEGAEGTVSETPEAKE